VVVVVVVVVVAAAAVGVEVVAEEGGKERDGREAERCTLSTTLCIPSTFCGEEEGEA